MGFDYYPLEELVYQTNEKGERTYHSFFFGNHDNPNAESSLKLGRFGIYNSLYQDLSVFFIGGADSIDKAYRIEGVSWWREEELNYREAEECIEKYHQYADCFGDDIILSHDCPQFLVNHLWGYSLSFTRKLLDTMWEIRKPKLWIFGHHHKSIDITIDGCRFVCLNELETMII